MVKISSDNSPKEKTFCKHNNFCFKDPENKMFRAFLYSLCHCCQSYAQFSSVIQSFQLFAAPWTAARLPCPSPNPEACSNSCPSSQWYHSTISSSVISFSSCLQSCPASGSFQRVSSSHQVAKVLEFELQHQSFQWIFRTDFLWIDWFDLLAVQGTFKSLLQHHSSKISILWHSAFFIVQFSHPYMTTGKTIVLTKWTFDKIMSLLFNMLSRFLTAFPLRSKHLLTSWLQSPSAVIFEPKKIKSLTVSIVSPSICHEVMDQMPWSSFSECWALSQLFHSPLSLSSRGSLVPLHFLP